MPLLIGDDERRALRYLAARAAIHPVNLETLAATLKTPAGERRHKRRMLTQSMALPIDFIVTFSINCGAGIMTRHMTLGIDMKKSRVLSGIEIARPEAIWLVAEQLGFRYGLENCWLSPETLDGEWIAVSLVQTMDSAP